MLYRHEIGILLVALIIGLTGCKDKGTGADPGEPPTLPDIQKEEAQMDLSFFQQNSVKIVTNNKVLSTNNFERAKTTALAFSGIFETSQVYDSFLQPVSGAEASFDAGVWEWTYNYSYEGHSIEIRTTAEVKEENIEWAMYWTYEDQEGNSFDNYKIFEGTVSTDGSQGEWRFNALNPDGTEEIAFLQYTWEIINDTEKNLTVHLYSETGEQAATIGYTEDLPDHTLMVEYPTEEGVEDITVFWNPETNEGYFQEGEGPQCTWDSDLQDTTCLE